MPESGILFIYPDAIIVPVKDMKKIVATFCLAIMMGSFAGCLFDEDNASIRFSECPSFWHIEFFDMSNNAFSSWNGEVEFVDSDGNKEVLKSFSSDKKYVILDESLSWKMTYTFYEYDIGFIIGDTVYGGDNSYGDSGTIDLDLERVYAHETQDSEGVSFSCESGDWDIMFIDSSNENFYDWGGDVRFESSGGFVVEISDFDSQMKYVTLDRTQTWTMDYTFYEPDIGFMYEGNVYGTNNDNGDSGRIIIPAK